MRRCCTVDNSNIMGINTRYKKVYKCRTCGGLWVSEIYVRTEKFGDLVVNREVMV
ncbi:MAG: hypothetical protein JSW41_03965 [Candidatus Aenigmatarchaeota archaeon]|nr:MAG: hypothetical protein JSW41_03965 [Candidatus Aenigmarchaeota archaeon]